MDSFSPRTPEMPQYHILNDYTFNNKGSLLHELYEHEIPPEYHQDSESFLSWHHPPTEYPIIRRATFPYVRQDRDDIHQYPPFYPLRQEPFYNEPPYQRFEETNIKLEDSTPLPQQNTNFYNSPQAMAMPYLSPHANLPVQHTDDAASKETQYLRRRCFNCHTTEPPSWRRSTLNPGKIVCNKCGLYERTHLRARPLRFDELRSGSKSRKPSSKASTSPKQSKLSMIKKEPRDLGLDRRGSLSSGSSAHSGSGASDWDDNGMLPIFMSVRLLTAFSLSSIPILFRFCPNYFLQFSCLPQFPSFSRFSITSPRRWYSITKQPSLRCCINASRINHYLHPLPTNPS